MGKLLGLRIGTQYPPGIARTFYFVLGIAQAGHTRYFHFIDQSAIFSETPKAKT